MSVSLLSLKYSARAIASVPLLLGLWRPLRRRVSILNYHRVTNDPEAARNFNPNRPLAVTEEAFDRQLRFLKANSRCLTIAEAVSCIEAGDRSGGGVAITFDDGYRDNLQLALPIAEKYQIPIAIFVTTGFVDRTADLWWEEHRFIIERCEKLTLELPRRRYEWTFTNNDDRYLTAQQLRILFKEMDTTQQRVALDQMRAQCSERYSYDNEILTWEELRELAKHPLVTLGAHTTTHAVLSRLNEGDAERELVESRARLSSELGIPFDYFAYPMGQKEHADKREFALAEQVKFRAAFTSRSGTITPLGQNSLFDIPRIPVDFDDTLSSFAWKASGL